MLERSPELAKTKEKRTIGQKIKRVLAITAISATALGGSLIAADEVLGRTLHQPTETSLIFENPPATIASAERTNETPTIVYELPGFNVTSESIDADLAPILNKYGSRVRIEYGDDLSPDVIAGKVAEQLHQQYGDALPKIVFYGHSIGGNISVRVVAGLINTFHIPADKLAVVLDCSPTSNGTVNTELAQNFVDFLSFIGKTPLHGGPLMRGTLEAVMAHSLENTDLSKSVRLGIERANPSQPEKSNAVFIKESSLLNDESGLQQATDVLRQHNVPVAFIAPGKLDDTSHDITYKNDGLVLDQLASKSWQQLLGNRVSEYAIQGPDYHGILPQTRNDYAKQIGEFFVAQGIVGREVKAG